MLDEKRRGVFLPYLNAYIFQFLNIHFSSTNLSVINCYSLAPDTPVYLHNPIHVCLSYLGYEMVGL